MYGPPRATPAQSPRPRAYTDARSGSFGIGFLYFFSKTLVLALLSTIKSGNNPCSD